MKFVVTGAAGFIGSNLSRLLLDSYPEAEIFGVDSFTDYYSLRVKRRNVARLVDPRFTLVEADIVECDLSFLSNATAIFHQAGQPGVRKSWGQDFGAYTHDNILGTQRILEAARELTTLERFIYASSSSVYGDAESYPTSELTLPAPKSPYGVTKLAAEHLVALYGRNFGLPTVSLRYFTVYGAGQRPDMAFNRFISSALNDRPIVVYGDGEQVREFTHIQDIAAANVLAWKSEVEPGDTMNVSGGAEISVNQALDLIREIHGDRIIVNYQAAALGDPRRTSGDATKARRILEWSPQMDIKDGLVSEYNWLADEAHAAADEVVEQR